MISFLIAFFALSFLVFFHELGHFLVARFFGVKVEVFSIGFGKKILSKQIGETQYAFSLIPLGGYVKLKGQSDSNPLESSQDSDSYSIKPPWVKIAILFAGPFFNFFLAFLLFVCVGSLGLQELLPIVGEVKKDMPAHQAGILTNDKIIAVDGKEILTWNGLREALAKTETMELKILRNDKEIVLWVTPQVLEDKNLFNETIQRGFIGITPRGDVGLIRLDFLHSLVYALKKTFEFSQLILMGIQKLIIGILPLSEIGGPVMIVDSIAKVAEKDFILLLLWVGLISVNLAVLNLLPIPALDGGQIIFSVYEWITRKPINEKAKYYLTICGWLILLSLMLLGLSNDIGRLLKS